MTLKDSYITRTVRNRHKPYHGSLARRRLPGTISVHWGTAGKKLAFHGGRSDTLYKRRIVLGMGGTSSTREDVLKRTSAPEEIKDLHQRLENVNAYFRWKAAEVFEDESAVRLLAKLYKSVMIEFSDFDSHKDGISLAKLTAAAFCEFSSTGIYITESGQRFIKSINDV